MKLLLSPESIADLPKWQQPEKATGWLVLAGAAVYFWGQIVPFLVDTVFDTVKLGVGLGALFVLFLLGTNRRIQAGLWYAGQRVLRTAAGIFVNTDPIGIMEDYIANTEREARKMDAEVGHIARGPGHGPAARPDQAGHALLAGVREGDGHPERGDEREGPAPAGKIPERRLQRLDDQRENAGCPDAFHL